MEYTELVFGENQEPDLGPIDKLFDSEQPVEDRVDDIVAVTGEDVDTATAKAAVLSESETQFNNIVFEAISEQKSADQVQTEVANHTAKIRDFSDNPTLLLEQVFGIQDKNVTALENRARANIQVYRELVSEAVRRTDASASGLGSAADFVDRYLFRQTLFGWTEDISRRKEREGNELINNAVNLTPKEFLAYAKNKIDEVSNEGFLSSKGLFALRENLDAALKLGFDPDGTLTALLGVLDVPLGGAVGVGVGAVNKLGRIRNAVSPAARIAASGGNPEAVEKAVTATLNKGPDPDTLVDIADPALNLSPPPIAVASTRTQKIMQEVKIVQLIEHLRKKSVFGEVATPEQILTKAREIATKQLEDVPNPLNGGIGIKDEGFGLYSATWRVGKLADGSPYLPVRTKAIIQAEKAQADGPTKALTPPPPTPIEYKAPKSVQNLAERLGGEVVPFDPEDLSKGFVVEFRERIDTTGLTSPINIDLNLARDRVRNTLGLLFNNRLLGSAALRDNERLTSLAQRAEGGRNAIKNIVRPYENSFKALDSKALFTVRRVAKELRDGADSWRRERYTDEEFKQKYKQFHPEGKEATKKELDAYHSEIELAETDWVLKATKQLQVHISKGYTRSVQINNDVFVPAKRLTRDQVPADAIVKDLDSPLFGTLKEIADDLGDDLPVWKLDKRLVTGEEYVIRPRSSRVIEPEDVFGYNPTGSRMNETAKYFVVIGAKEGGGRLRALLTAFSDKDATLAVKQLQTIRDAINKGAKNIDEIINANNDWNPSIQTKAQFEDLALKEGWIKNKGDIFEGAISKKERDQKVDAGEIDSPDIWTNSTIKDYVDNDMRRRDKVLLDFGGGRASNVDPISSTLSQFSQSSFAYSNRVYTQSAMVGWVKTAQELKKDYFPPGISKSDYATLFKEAKIVGNSPTDIRMRELRNITLRRLNMQDDASEALERLGGELSEYIFGVSKKAGLKAGLKTNVGDPTNTLLKIGFQSAFGFFNVSQFFMQAMHATTVMAIAGRNGLKGAGMVLGQRGLLQVTDPKAYKEGVNRFAKNFDLKPEEAEDLFEYIRTSGRNIVGADTAEAGTGVGYWISNWGGDNMSYSSLKGKAENVSNSVSKGLDLGLAPFKQGERLSRLTAINTAYLEFKAANPGVSAMSELGRSWIGKREQALLFNMGTVDRAMVQSSLMKAPTQWLAYSLRSMESVFVGRGLEKGERFRLFLALAPFYGLAGFGLQNSAEYIAEALDVPPDSALVTGLKYGMLDALSEVLLGTGQGIGFGQRLAPIGAFLDTYKKIVDEGTLTTLGGPSGEIVGGIASAFFDTLGDLWSGNSVMLTEDLIKVLRQPSGIDNFAKGIGAFNNGYYRSKNGVVAPGTMGTSESIALLFGFTPLSTVDWYNTKNSVYANNKGLASFRKELKRDADYAYSILKSDPQRATQLMKEIHAKIATSGFSFRERLSLGRSVVIQQGDQMHQMFKDLFLNDRRYQAQALSARVRGE